MDRDAFMCAAAMMQKARQEVLISQLFFAIPEKFVANPATEKPSLVFDFDQPKPLDLKIPFPRPLRPGRQPPGTRAAAPLPAAVSTCASSCTRSPCRMFIRIAVGVLLFPYLIFKGLTKPWTLLGDDLTDTDEVKRYFEAAAAPNLKVLPFEQPALSAGVIARQADDDGPGADAQHRLTIRSELRRSTGPRHRCVDSRQRDRATRNTMRASR